VVYLICYNSIVVSWVIPLVISPELVVSLWSLCFLKPPHPYMLVNIKEDSVVMFWAASPRTL